MDEAGEKRVRAEGSRGRTSKVDRISDLPESLLCQVLLNLTTKDVVKTSVLSSRWRNRWKFVPGLDLNGVDIRKYYRYVRFVDRFLDFNSESHIESFKLSYPGDGNGETEIDLIRRWINTVVRMEVKYLDFWDYSWSWESGTGTFHIPPSIYTCKSLVCLKLCDVTMSSLKLVSLPYLRNIELIRVEFADNLGLETLITGCTALERLLIKTSSSDRIEVLRVRSQSLLSFTYVEEKGSTKEDLVVVLDAPRLEYLNLSDHQTACFIIKNPGSLVSVDINIVFNLFSTKLHYGRYVTKSRFHERFDPSDLPKRYMIRNFLEGISCVKNMIISSITLAVIYGYSRCEPLPLFHNLSSLCVEFYDFGWEMLPTFLLSYPNLKSLVLASTKYPENEGITPTKYPENEGISLISGPRCFLSSLEYVDIERPLKGEAMEMKLVSYLLENSTVLKKLTLCLDDSIKKEESVIFKELLTIPRLSSACQVVVG